MILEWLFDVFTRAHRIEKKLDSIIVAQAAQTKKIDALVLTERAVMAAQSALMDGQAKELAAIELVSIQVKKLADNLIPGDTVSATIQLYDPDGNALENGEKMTIKDTQSIDFVIIPKDAKGNPSKIDPTKTALAPSDPTLADIVVNADGLTGTLVAKGVGSVSITGTISDDASDGSDGGQIVIQSEVVDIVAGDTATAIITFGTPVAQ